VSKKYKIVCQRHGDTNKAEEGAHDRTRTLTADGVKQAMSLGQEISGPLHLIISSGAARSTRTAEITARVATGKDQINVVEIPELYPDEELWPQTAKAFGELKYSPLKDYLLRPAVADELNEYAKLALKLIFEQIKALPTVGEEIVVLVTTHAICTNAIVRELQMSQGEDLDHMLHIAEATSIAPGAAIVCTFEEEDLVEVAYVTP